MRQITLVSLYQEKPKELADLINHCQNAIAGMSGIEFTRYDLRQIHATLLGLERVTGSSMHNLNLAKYRSQLKTMDIQGFLNCLRLSGYVPFQVQIGGFQNRDYPFTSRGQRPYDRSFLIQGNKAVMMGWPVHGQLRTPGSTTLELLREAQIYPSTLDTIRRTAQAFNILHAYHRASTDVDNDFYFRIGLVSETLNSSLKRSLEGSIREFLSRAEPIILDITGSDLSVASYEDEALPLSSTKVLPLRDTKLTQELIRSLYE